MGINGEDETGRAKPSSGINGVSNKAKLRTGCGGAKSVIISSEDDQFAKTARMHAAKTAQRAAQVRFKRESRLMGVTPPGENPTLASIKARRKEIARRIESQT